MEALLTPCELKWSTASQIHSHPLHLATTNHSHQMNVESAITHPQPMNKSSIKSKYLAKQSKLVKKCKEAFRKAVYRVQGLLAKKTPKAQVAVDDLLSGVDMKCVDGMIIIDFINPITIDLPFVAQDGAQTNAVQDAAQSEATKAGAPEDADLNTVKRSNELEKLIAMKRKEKKQGEQEIEWLFAQKANWTDRQVKSAVVFSSGGILIECTDDSDDQMFLRSASSNWSDIGLVKQGLCQWYAKLPVGNTKEVEFAVSRVTNDGSVSWLNSFEQNYIVRFS